MTMAVQCSEEKTSCETKGSRMGILGEFSVCG